MAADEKYMESKRHDMLKELAEHVQLVAEEHGIDEELAEQFGVNVANFIAEHFGGLTFSFPVDYHYKIAKRDKRIFDAHCKGMSMAKLSREYNMTENGIWRVIDRTSKRLKRRMQPDLFGECEDE